MTPSASRRIFVSHSHQDNDFGRKLVQDLQNALGDETAVWYDTAGGLQGGDPWWSKIKQELKACSVFLVVLSPDAIASKWVNDEINIAWKQKNSPTGKHIIPILYSACEVPEDLETLQIISFLPPNSYEQAFKELLKALSITRQSRSGASTILRPPLLNFSCTHLNGILKRQESDFKFLAQHTIVHWFSTPYSRKSGSFLS